jgi:hypothetical protein
VTSSTSGKYLSRAHNCALPVRVQADPPRVGDIWKCECGRRWRFGVTFWDALSGIPFWHRYRWPWGPR